MHQVLAGPGATPGLSYVAANNSYCLAYVATSAGIVLQVCSGAIKNGHPPRDGRFFIAVDPVLIFLALTPSQLIALKL